MADTKISNLTALAATPDSGDWFAVVDTSASATKKLDAKYLVGDSGGTGAKVTGAYTLTLTGNSTANQNVSTTGTPTFAQATVDNLRLDGNTFSSTSGAVTVAPLAGQDFNVDLSTTGDFAVSTNQLYVDTSANMVGIGGITAPAAQLHILTTNAATGGIRLQSSLSDETVKNGRIKVGHYTNAEEPVTILIANGQSSSNTLMFGGGSGVENAITQIDFYTGATNTTTTGTSRMTITNNGYVGINETTPNGQLDVRQTNTTAAIPTIYLQQADDSEEFFELASTVGSGAPIDTVTAVGTTYARMRVMVNGVGFKYIQLYNA